MRLLFISILLSACSTTQPKTLSEACVQYHTIGDAETFNQFSTKDGSYELDESEIKEICK